MIRSAVRAAAHRPALRARLPSSVSVPQQQRAQRSILLQTAILSSSRALSTGPTPPVTTANAAPTATTTPAEAVNEKGQAGLPPPPPPKRKRAGFFKILGRVTAGVVVVSIGTFGYFIYEGRHPPDQLPADSTKKTIVVLGSGWGATSLLKGLDTEHYNVIVVSPHNYFLFTPLLPSVTVGTLDGRSIVQPTRHTTRFKRRAVQVYEAEAESIDVQNKTVTFEDKSEIKGHLGSITVPYDYLVYAVGSENQTFGIQGIREHACFLKELGDAVQIRTRLMDCIETASLRGQSPEEIERLLHMVVVGGGPTGIEYAAELRDFIESDLVKWYPEVANKVRVTLVEALPKILPMFSQTLIAYTEQTFKDRSINLLTQHMVKDVDAETITVQDPQKELVKIPYGLLVWAAGNTARPLTRSLMSQLASSQTNRRGLEVDDHMRLKGAEDSIFAIGDATATAFAPTAQAASQQGTYLARVFGQMARADALASKLEEAKAQGGEAESETKSIERQLAKAEKLRPFHYSHQGSLAYIGSDKAIADLPFMNGSFASGGVATFLFWRSAYFSMLFSLRNRTMVAADWLSVKLFGRDVSRE